MRLSSSPLVVAASCLAAALLTTTATACNVPVFRYALERWTADPYEIVVFYTNSLTPKQLTSIEIMDKLARDNRANLKVTRADLNSEIPMPLRGLWKTQQTLQAALPWVLVNYPPQTHIQTPAWSAPLTDETTAALVDSPTRRSITQKLLNGDAIVWLLLESGNKLRDDQIHNLLQTECRQLEKSLVLPEQSALDLPINPDLPLKIAFSTVRLARTDPAERVLLNLLLNCNTNRTNTSQPMLFPIFGRGRVMPPAIGDEIRPEAIRDMAEFLTGPCSCEIKQMNPGYDLLLAANWGGLTFLSSGPLSEPPPLTGMSQFIAASGQAGPPPSRLPETSEVLAVAASVQSNSNHLSRNLIIFFAGALALLAILTWVLKNKANRNPQ